MEEKGLIFNARNFGPLYLYRDEDDPYLFRLETKVIFEDPSTMDSPIFIPLTVLTEADLNNLFDSLVEHLKPGQRRRVHLQLTLFKHDDGTTEEISCARSTEQLIEPSPFCAAGDLISIGEEGRTMMSCVRCAGSKPVNEFGLPDLFLDQIIDQLEYWQTQYKALVEAVCLLLVDHSFPEFFINNKIHPRYQVEAWNKLLELKEGMTPVGPEPKSSTVLKTQKT